MDEYRFTKDGVAEVETVTTKEAYRRRTEGWNVEVSFGGMWFPVHDRPVAL